MFQRYPKRPGKSFFLLGPRGTGKSTWLGTLSFDHKIDFLVQKDRMAYTRDVDLLEARTAHLKDKSWILIDDVQKVPEILNAVHRLYEQRRFNFALSGSSARKLKRSGVNLLGGRAIMRRMYPLTYTEYSSSALDVGQLIEWGTLPLVLDQFDARRDTLSSYVETYLTQEIMEERIVNSLEPFARFLSIAGQINGQVLNVENIARESKVKRTTVDNYLEVLEETLISYKLPAYQPNIRINEAARPKMYFFDSGVARACAGLIYDEIDGSTKGFLFETFLLNEVRAYNEHAERHKFLAYYSIRSSYEIDLIIQIRKKSVHTPDQIIACEFKSGRNWRSEWSASFDVLRQDFSKTEIKRAIVVYGGEHRESHGNVELMPVKSFLEALWSGLIF